MGIEDIRRLKSGLPKKKKTWTLNKKSPKRKQQEEAEKALRGPNEDSLLEGWFKRNRPLMTGRCACGCGKVSSKKEDAYFRHSQAHIFPQKDFQSVRYHPDNWVERSFWDGCHTNFDQNGVDKWPKMADWEEIKRKYHIIAPLLTDTERASKFYAALEPLVSKH